MEAEPVKRQTFWDLKRHKRPKKRFSCPTTDSPMVNLTKYTPNPKAKSTYAVSLQTLQYAKTKCGSIPIDDIGTMSPDNQALCLTMKVGIENAMVLLQAVKHVPIGFPERNGIIADILSISAPQTIIDGYIAVADSCTHQIPPVNIESYLWTASKKTKKTLLYFFSPKVDTCLAEGCGQVLGTRNRAVVNVTLFTTSGPVPGMRSSKICYRCQSTYFLDK